jgi:hypothetical protein
LPEAANPNQNVPVALSQAEEWDVEGEQPQIGANRRLAQ